MDLNELQNAKTETELPICLGSPLVGKKEEYVVNEFGIKIIHTHLNPKIKKETRNEYEPNKLITVGTVLHIVGTHKQMDELSKRAF